MRVFSFSLEFSCSLLPVFIHLFVCPAREVLNVDFSPRVAGSIPLLKWLWHFGLPQQSARLSGLKLQKCVFTALEARSPKATCWQGLAPSETSREDAPSLPFSFKWVPRFCRLLQSFACLLALSSCGLIHIPSPPGKDTGYIDLGPAWWSHLTWLLKDFSQKITFKVTQKSYFRSFCGARFSPQYRATYYILILQDTRWGASCWIFTVTWPCVLLHWQLPEHCFRFWENI